MKLFLQYLFILSVFVFSCQQPNDVLPCIDVRKNYPEKEILLTDIAQITYLCPNSDEREYLFSGGICVVTKNTVVIADARKGDILFFSKEGIPKSHFNRQGNGPGEYRSPIWVLYDEDADDVFVTYFSSTIIQVYSSTGVHKRELALPQGTRMGNDWVSYDDDAILYYDVGMEYKRVDVDNKNLPAENLVSPFYLISKADGAVLEHIELPIPSFFLGINHNGMRIPASRKIRLTKGNTGVLLCNPERDTVFLYGRGKPLTPILHKIPLVNATTPMTYLNNCLDLGSYQFMEVYTVRAGDVYPGIFPVTYYLRNKKSGEIFRQKLLLPDFKGQEFIIRPLGNGRRIENGDYFELDITELKQAYAENKLSGKLKELVATLKEDDNNVYVIAEFKE